MAEKPKQLPDEAGPMPSSKPIATILWDNPHNLPLESNQSKDEVVLLLTPVVIPPRSQRNTTSDPFEPLGRLLSQRNLTVRHVPYTRKGGITGAHVAFIRRADAIIFVLTGLSQEDEISQLEMADLVGEACESRPFIVVTCCEVHEDELQRLDFPTLIRANGFAEHDLRIISSLLLDRNDEPTQETTRTLAYPTASSAWSMHSCNYEQDLPHMYNLWLQETPGQFHLDQSTFGSLLMREGFAMHHVVRASPSQEVVGFCVAYTTFADSEGEQLIGSIAAIIVRQDFRRRSIGKALYDEVLSKLRKIRGVNRIQLGSTFPRLLYGLPNHHPDTKWFQDLGWVLNQSAPGMGRLMADWLLIFADGPATNLASAGLNFRSCSITDAAEVREMVGRECERKFGFGWFDQYERLLDNVHIDDIVVGFEGATLVAAAITHTPNGGNPTAADVPWPASIGSDIGGISCICIKGKRDEVVQPLDRHS
jgi:ribosomal protein S18 acetylase RimI-like enzyme